MPEEYEEQVEEKEGERSLWKKPKRNWGFWILIIGFILFCITWFIIKPKLGL